MNTQTKPPAVASATPGPWLVYTDDEAFVIRDKAKHARVARTQDFYHPDIQRANAHLIAAAPDLLTALEDGRDALMQCVARYPELANMVLSANLHMQAALNQAQS